MVNGILWKTLKSPCGAPLCTYAKVHNKKNIYFPHIYNPWKCQSESVKVKVWKWKCESENVKVKMWKWKFEGESDSV